MYTPEELEQIVFRLIQKKFVLFLMDNSFLKREYICPGCDTSAKLVNTKRNIDTCVRRCNNSQCKNYQNFFSIRVDRFLEALK